MTLAPLGKAQFCEDSMAPRHCQMYDKMEDPFIVSLLWCGRVDTSRVSAIDPDEPSRSVEMIRFLSIQNLAVVEELEIEFGPGLTVLTGETGAGKSIVVGALGLLVGGRSSGDLVRTGAHRAKIQATLEDQSSGREIIVRREIGANGRSRAFVDDTPATVGALQSVGRQQVDLHGQHEHQELLHPDSHVLLLDAYGDLLETRREVGDAFKAWRSTRGRLERASRQGRHKNERIDLLTFQRDEIDAVSLERGEDEILSSTRTRLANADRLQSLASDVYASLYERDDAILTRLGAVWRKLGELSGLDRTFTPYLEGQATVSSQLEDLAFLLRSYAAQIEASPDELSRTEARLSKIEHLKRRYGPTLDDVLEHRSKIEDELEVLTVSDEALEALATEEQRTRSAFLGAAERLSALRRMASGTLARALARTLIELAIPKARFEILFNTSPLGESEWTELGIDTVEYFFSANPGEVIRPLAKVASGGELSRIMLGLKTLATTDCPGKTLVFDEVDAGIGGAVADRVGQMLKKISRHYQVVCVTHLPQIAAYATSHRLVSKTVEQGRTITLVEELANRGRVAELAKLMTGGDAPRALASATELLVSKQEQQGAKGERSE